MVGSIRRLLWGAFAALIVLVAIGLAVNLALLNSERKQEFAIIQGSEPLLDAIRDMDDDVNTMIAASRGFLLTGETRFLQQYEDSIREFNKSQAIAAQQATDPRDELLVTQYRGTFEELHALSDNRSRARRRETTPAPSSSTWPRFAGSRRTIRP